MPEKNTINIFSLFNNKKKGSILTEKKDSGIFLMNTYLRNKNV